ncbi:Regulator of microtubule dynamics protein 3 [Nibea albiflora]|uniref:Regulator of microtubule dynamics protein 3 n=1 Tax=Nibea albiflora TaxID=240163 RepID=A0ACB7FA32_NIBAL|nr:Regulator of microtubule dynamics protein 3 [Nibea albiflora]
MVDSGPQCLEMSPQSSLILIFRFAVLTGLSTQHESMHSKLKSSHILKEHLDRAVALRDNDPMCFYLLGRWCYEAEELSPGFSKTVRLYIAQCHKELGNISEATNWTELALKTPTNSNDVRGHCVCYMTVTDACVSERSSLFFSYFQGEEMSKLEAQLQVLTDSKI